MNSQAVEPTLAVSENVPVQIAVPGNAKRPEPSEKRLRAVHQAGSSPRYVSEPKCLENGLAMRFARSVGPSTSRVHPPFVKRPFHIFMTYYRR